MQPGISAPEPHNCPPPRASATAIALAMLLLSLVVLLVINTLQARLSRRGR